MIAGQDRPSSSGRLVKAGEDRPVKCVDFGG